MPHHSGGGGGGSGGGRQVSGTVVWFLLAVVCLAAGYVGLATSVGWRQMRGVGKGAAAFVPVVGGSSATSSHAAPAAPTVDNVARRQWASLLEELNGDGSGMEYSRDDETGLLGGTTDVASVLQTAGVDAPLLRAMAPELASATVGIAAQAGAVMMGLTPASCNDDAMRTETMPPRHPRERRLVVLSCGGVATTYVMESLATALAPFGYTVNCREADMAHYKHRFPDEGVDAGVLPSLFCYEPDRLLYLFSDPLTSVLSVHRRGFLSCGGMHPAWDPSLWLESHVQELTSNLSVLVGAFEARRHDMLGRLHHHVGWSVAHLPAPLLFVDMRTVFTRRHILTDFLGVPRGALDSMTLSTRTSDNLLRHVPAGSAMRSLYANIYRQVRILDRHLVVPQGFVDRIRTPLAAGADLSYMPPPQLYCPAKRGIKRTAVRPEAMAALSARSHALDEGTGALCGDTWRTALADYAAYHAGVRATLLAAADAAAATGKPLPRGLPQVVVWRCPINNFPHGCGGLADRLVGLTSVFVFGMVHRRLVLLDVDNASLPLVPGSAGIDWRVDERLLAGRPTTVYNLYNCNTKENAQPCLWSTQRPHVSMAADIAIINSNRGFIGADQPYPPAARLGLPLHLAPTCVYHAVWAPAPHITARAAAVYATAGLPWPPPLRPRTVGAGGVTTVGVHFRAGDDTMAAAVSGNATLDLAAVAERERAISASIVACVANVTSALAASGRPYYLFIAGDSAAIRAQLADGYPPGNATQSGAAPVHVEAAAYQSRHAALPPSVTPITAADDALVEWLLLAAADVHVLTHSGYSRTAWAYAGVPYAVLGADNYIVSRAAKPTCRAVSILSMILGAYSAGV